MYEIHVYSFITSFTYTHSCTHSHIHSCILIHKFSFTYSFHKLMHIFIYLTDISNTNNSNQYTYTYMYFTNSIHNRSQSHLSSYHLCMTNISNNNHSNQYIYVYIYIYIYIYISQLTFITNHHRIFNSNLTLLRNWNQSNRIIQDKVMAFSCQTSRFTRITLETVRITNFSGVLTLYLTQGLCTNLKLRC